MTLEMVSTVLLATAAFISLVVLIASWLRPRSDEERRLNKVETAIRQKRRELSDREQAGGDRRVQQVSVEIEQARREIFGGRGT